MQQAVAEYTLGNMEESQQKTDMESEVHIEELSVKDLEVLKDSDAIKQSKTLSAVAVDLNQASTGMVCGSVSVSNSDNVHFGNNTYFNGPVVIKHIVHTKSGCDNSSYMKTESDNELNSERKQSKNKTEEKKTAIKTWHKISLMISGLVILIAACAVIILRSGHPAKDKNFPGQDTDITNTSLSDLLQIPQFHLRIVSRSEWLAQPVENKLDDLTPPVPWVIISHTATESCSIQSECVLRVRLIQQYHVESRGWFDIGYNFLVGGDGSAYMGRGWDYVGAHTKGFNFFSIGIAFIGTFNSEPPTEQQLDACKKLMELGVKLGKLTKDYKLLGHRQLMSTLSPGDRVFNVIKEWPHFVTNVTGALPSGKH